jgi:hypothetical protein
MMPAPTSESRRAKVDRFAILDGQVIAFKPTLSEHKDLRDEILAWYPQLDNAESQTAEGEAFDVLITARDNERAVTVNGKKRLVKLFGIAEFLKRCAFTLKQLPGGEDPENLFTIRARIGPRHLKPVPKQQSAA